MLGPTLLRLASVVHVLVLGLLDPITGQTGDGGPHGARGPVADPGCEVLDLPARLLLLSGAVLLAACLLEALRCLLAT